MKRLVRKKTAFSLLNNVRATLKLDWKINRLTQVAYAALALLQVASSILAVYIVSRIVGVLTSFTQTRQVDIANLYLLVALSGLVLLAERFAWRWLSLLERRAWIRWYQKMSIEVNAVISQLDMPQHHDAKFEKMLTKVIQQYQYLPQNFAASILQFFHSTVRLLTTLAVIVAFAPLIALIMLVSLIPGFITEKRLSDVQWSLWYKKGDTARFAWRTPQYLQEKNKLQETKIFGTRGYLLGYLEKLHNSFYDEQLSNLRDIRRPALLSLVVEGAALIGVNVWLIQQVIYGGFSIETFVFYSGIIGQFGSSLGLIINSLTRIYDDNIYMRDFFKLLGTKPLLPKPAHPHSLSPDVVPEVRFEDVSFKYPGSESWTLHHINLVIKPGEKIAFVGENGAGKTTIVKLLLRFYDCTEGRITVNGIDIKEVDLTTYYNHIGVLFQNFNDYPFSVKKNIGFGRVQNIGDDQGIRNAAALAQADTFIDDYPLKYEQLLEVGFEKGIEPSGGQWQRIALARALFRDAGILILDEPTAAVDAKSEYAIFKTLSQHSEGKTTVIISHRFSTVRTAEQIYVIENGEITESGSHENLMKLAGTYHDMFSKQAEGYK